MHGCLRVKDYESSTVDEFASSGVWQYIGVVGYALEYMFLGAQQFVDSSI